MGLVTQSREQSAKADFVQVLPRFQPPGNCRGYAPNPMYSAGTASVSQTPLAD
jgi:hypothetical protein